MLGLSFTALLFALIAYSHKAASVSLALLAWPGLLIAWFKGIDCPNADSIPDKMECAGLSLMSLAIVILTYSPLFFFLLWLVEKWRGEPKTDPGFSIK